MLFLRIKWFKVAICQNDFHFWISHRVRRSKWRWLSITTLEMNGIPAAVKAVSVDKLMLVSCNSEYTYNDNSVRWRLKDGLRQKSLWSCFLTRQEVRTPTRIQLGIEGANLSGGSPDFKDICCWCAADYALHEALGKIWLGTHKKSVSTRLISRPLSHGGLSPTEMNQRILTPSTLDEFWKKQNGVSIFV